MVSLMCHMLSDAGRMGAREGRRRAEDTAQADRELLFFLREEGRLNENVGWCVVSKEAVSGGEAMC